MTIRICQAAGTALLLGLAGGAHGQVKKFGFQPPVSPEVRTARMFFAALDRANLAQVSAIASPQGRPGRAGTLRARRAQFGQRWGDENTPREVVRVDDGGTGRIVTFRARYERATLEQVAFVTCMKVCQVTAFKEGPVSAKY